MIIIILSLFIVVFNIVAILVYTRTREEEHELNSHGEHSHLQLHCPHTWNSLPFDIRSSHTAHTFKNTLKHACSDSLNLKPLAPLYPLQDFKALYKYCIITFNCISPQR